MQIRKDTNCTKERISDQLAQREKVVTLIPQGHNSVVARVKMINSKQER